MPTACRHARSARTGAGAALDGTLSSNKPMRRVRRALRGHTDIPNQQHLSRREDVADGSEARAPIDEELAKVQTRGRRARQAQRQGGFSVAAAVSLGKTSRRDALSSDPTIVVDPEGLEPRPVTAPGAGAARAAGHHRRLAVVDAKAATVGGGNCEIQ